MKIHEYDYPGKQVHLELSSIDLLPEKITELAVEAIQVFCSNFISPLTLDLIVDNCDPEFLLPQISNPSFYYLRLQEFPPQVEQEAAWQGASTEIVSTINPESITNWISKSIDQKTNHDGYSNNSSVVFWQQILIRSTQVCLPNSVDLNGRTLAIQRGSHVINYPIQRINDEGYVSGPIKSKSSTAPIELNVTIEAGLLSLDINVLWTLWTEVEFEGIAQLASGLERLYRLGWICIYSEIEGLSI